VIWPDTPDGRSRSCRGGYLHSGRRCLHLDLRTAGPHRCCSTSFVAGSCWRPVANGGPNGGSRYVRSLRKPANPDIGEEIGCVIDLGRKLHGARREAEIARAVALRHRCLDPHLMRPMRLYRGWQGWTGATAIRRHIYLMILCPGCARGKLRDAGRQAKYVRNNRRRDLRVARTSAQS
jgi:hypothetical protein